MLQDNGFKTLDELISCYNQVKCSWPDAEKNEPLTLEELRRMNGQPVWMACLPLDACDREEQITLFGGRDQNEQCFSSASANAET